MKFEKMFLILSKQWMFSSEGVTVLRALTPSEMLRVLCHWGLKVFSIPWDRLSTSRFRFSKTSTEKHMFLIFRYKITICSLTDLRPCR